MKNIKRFISITLLITLILTVLIAPCILYGWLHSDVGFMITSVLFSLPIACLLLLLRNRYVIVLVLFIALLFSFLEIAMVVDFDNFLIAGNILALLSTTPEESTSFVQNNLKLLWYYIPVIICFIFALRIWANLHISVRTGFVLFVSSLLIAVAFVLFKIIGDYDNKLTYRYYIENRIFDRPPYNGPYQISRVIKVQQRRKAIDESNNFSFHSFRNKDIPNRETYVLAIGESMRYDNISLNGYYQRSTTPKLEKRKNLVSYGDYYSTACLTMFSVPQIITRATPENYDLSFKEKSIFLPFKENGFKTFGIVCNNLLDYEEYLTSGVDSLFKVEADKEIPVIIDSLSRLHSKTFFIVQFLGCHSYYYNYEPSFDKYHPNINSDPQIKSDSLYINAYDNTILYADHILNEIISSIDKPETVASLVFTSDHGENLTASGGGHGGDCAPIKTEYHVPFICWYSDDYASLNPEKISNLEKNKNEPISSDNVFYSVCDMSNISLAKQYSKEDYSVFSNEFETHQRYVLVPDGVSIIKVE